MPDLFDDLAAGGDTEPTERVRAATRRDLPKRFYRAVAVEAAGEGWRVLLDGRPVKTPARAEQVVPGRVQAEALAAEWERQGTHVDPGTMPLTRLANSAIDGVATEIDAVAAEIARYAGSDMLFYRAEGPDRLVSRQTELWDPIVAWAEDRYGRRFRLAEGVMPVEQDADVVEAVRTALPRDAFVLAGLHTATTLSGSVLIATALLEGRLTVDEAWTAAHVDEDWNIELWGEDEEAAERRRYRRAEMEAAALLMGRVGT